MGRSGMAGEHCWPREEEDGDWTKEGHGDTRIARRYQVSTAGGSGAGTVTRRLPRTGQASGRWKPPPWPASWSDKETEVEDDISAIGSRSDG